MDFHNKILLQFEPEAPSVKCHGQTIIQSKEGLWVTSRNQRAKRHSKNLQSPNLHQVFEVTFNHLIYLFSEN